MAKQENALQQLILMALNDNAIVVQQTCKTLSEYLMDNERHFFNNLRFKGN